ncbi:MAG: DedA family protein [Rhodobacteraceae bacterium]|nr:DedA family protein [Paracoccaceae bacterium]
MLRRLYQWTMSLAKSRYALLILAVISFFEASVFPIPPDALMIPMILAAPRRAFLIAGVTTVSSVLGGALGYGAGIYLFEEIGRPVLEFYGKTDAFETFKFYYNELGAAILLLSGITPFPFKVTTILSGATELNFGLFMVFTFIGRGIRFFLVATLLWKFGPDIRHFIEKRLGTVFTIGLLALLGGFLILWLI